MKIHVSKLPRRKTAGKHGKLPSVQADQIDASNLVRVYGALLWNVGKVGTFGWGPKCGIFLWFLWDFVVG